VANRAAIRGAHALPGEIAVQGVNEGFQTVGALGGTSGVGCYAPPSWNALEVTGKAAFTRAGVLTIAAGKQSATVSGIPLTALSFILATPTRYRSGHWVAAAVPNAAAGTITIHLNRKAAGAVSVAWIVLERIQMV
jgi:hypothetical protein